MKNKREPIKMPTPHQEWMVLNSWRVLHRISDIDPVDLEGDLLPNGEGVALCGASGHFMVPGLFSRMGLRRCAKCCDLLGIPRGDGNTLNGGIKEPRAKKWKHYDTLAKLYRASRRRYLAEQKRKEKMKA